MRKLSVFCCLLALAVAPRAAARRVREIVGTLAYVDPRCIVLRVKPEYAGDPDAGLHPIHLRRDCHVTRRRLAIDRRDLRTGDRVRVGRWGWSAVNIQVLPNAR